MLVVLAMLGQRTVEAKLHKKSLFIGTVSTLM